LALQDIKLFRGNLISLSFASKKGCHSSHVIHAKIPGGVGGNSMVDLNICIADVSFPD